MLEFYVAEDYEVDERVANIKDATTGDSRRDYALILVDFLESQRWQLHPKMAHRLAVLLRAEVGAEWVTAILAAFADRDFELFNAQLREAVLHVLRTTESERTACLAGLAMFMGGEKSRTELQRELPGSRFKEAIVTALGLVR